MGASIAKMQDQYLDMMLRRAVDRSDPRETEYYLRAGADPNAFNDTVPLLLLAASKWNEEPSKSSHPNLEPCVPLTLVRKLEVSGEKYGFLDDDLPEETSDVRRAARIKAIFDATVLAHCIVASRRYAYASSARRRVFDNPDLPNEVAGFLGLKATRR